MGLASGQLQAANAAKAAADAQRSAGISGIVGGVASGLMGGLGGGLMKGIGGKLGGLMKGIGGKLGGAAAGTASIQDPGFDIGIEGGITGPTIGLDGKTQFKDLSNLKIKL